MNTKEKWLHHVCNVRAEYSFGVMQQKRNVENNLHCESGPAVITPTSVCCYVNGRKHGYYADVYGTVLYYFQNVMVPPRYIKSPDSLTVEQILKENNQEVRRVGLEIYGFERMVEEGYFKVLHHDRKTRAKLLSFSLPDEDPVVVVQVFNGTPEPDGHHKAYFLKVPPTMKTCQEAIAWTFYMDEKDYHPIKET
jgi:hypothetical protein